MDEPVFEGAEASHGARSSRSLFRVGFDWMFRSRQTGRITVAQRPNIALWIFLSTVVLRWIVRHGSWVHAALAWIAAGALGWWALDEVIRGVNPWRRLLGLAGCVVVVAGVASSLR